MVVRDCSRAFQEKQAYILLYESIKAVSARRSSMGKGKVPLSYVNVQLTQPVTFRHLEVVFMCISLGNHTTKFS
jgi:hypothetical protein